MRVDLEKIATEVQNFIAGNNLASRYAARLISGRYNYEGKDSIHTKLVVYDIKSREKWGDYLCIIDDSRTDGEFSVKWIMGGECDGYTLEEAINEAVREIKLDCGLLRS